MRLWGAILVLLAGCGISQRTMTMPIGWPNEVIFIDNTTIGSSLQLAIIYDDKGKLYAVETAGGSGTMGLVGDVFGLSAPAANALTVAP